MPFLIFLIFFSKVSFQFIPGFPREIPNIIFQSGLHPYLNITVCLLFGSFLILKRLTPTGPARQKQSRIFRSYVFVFCAYLVTITCLQVLLGEQPESALTPLGAAGLSVFMVLLFGEFLATQEPAEQVLERIRSFATLWCWLSLAMLVISPSTCFMGGRFIGVFKHIPHMVSTATLACVLNLFSIFGLATNRSRDVKAVLHFLCGFFLLVLTGTRSALAAVIMAVMLCFVLFRPRLTVSHFLKVSVTISMLGVFFFFGMDFSEYAYRVVRGEESVGLRAAQDGIGSRTEEVLRGFDFFQDEPWLGHGILSKFSQNEDGGVGSYSANRDPHNLLVSAGVVGGWFFVFVVLCGFLGLILLTLRRLRSENRAIRMFAIYMLTQIPILFIYHIHISVGGIADRVYWLAMGVLALSAADDLERRTEKDA